MRDFVSFDTLNPAQDVLVSETFSEYKDEIQAFVRAGGTALILPQDAEHLPAAGIIQKIYGVKPSAMDTQEPVLEGIGPEMLNFRRPLTLTVFRDGLLDGLLKQERIGAGCLICVQLDARELYRDVHTPLQIHNVDLPKLNIYKFYRQLLTNLQIRDLTAPL